MALQSSRDVNKIEDLYNLTDSEREILSKWIRENLTKINTINKRHTSYGLKHYFENDKINNGFYVTNGQFKGAMLICGFFPEKRSELNWRFKISEKSITALEKRGVLGCL